MEKRKFRHYVKWDGRNVNEYDVPQYRRATETLGLEYEIVNPKTLRLEFSSSVQKETVDYLLAMVGFMPKRRHKNEVVRSAVKMREFLTEMTGRYCSHH